MTDKQIVRVYDAVQGGARTSIDVAAETGLSIKTASAWLSELERGELIRRVGTVKYPGCGRRATRWLPLEDAP
jgi:predicted Rossmann fold nucleotide-binding protein DprA/Smf involved in DNA uptake